MPSGTRSKKEKDLLFSDDPAHLERTIRRGQRSTSLDATTSSSIDTHNQPSTDTRPSSIDTHNQPLTDTRPSSSIDPNRSTTIDITPRTSIDTVSSKMVNVVILTHDENRNMYDQDGHLRAALPVDEDARSTPLADYNRPDEYYSNRSAIRLPEIQKQNFKLKPQYYTLVSQIPYSGLPHEHPMDHLERFYYQNPPPQTQESKIKEMLDRVLLGQQQITVDFNGKIDSAYNNLNTKIETLGTQVRKLETQLIQTGETIKRQEAFAREAGADKAKHHVNAIIDDDFWQVVRHEKLEEGDFEIESSMSLGGSQWC
ncbi:hypothetical protein YC2023_071486 [Brassica napus]